MDNRENLTEEEVKLLEDRLLKLLEKIKVNAYKLTYTTDEIEKVLKEDLDTLKLETLYAQEFGFATENYELSEMIESVINRIYLFDDSRLLPRRIEKEYKKYLLVTLTDT